MYTKRLDNLAPLNLPTGEWKFDPGIETTAQLRRTTAEELLRLGTRQVVYLKAGTCDGEIIFVIHGANGTPIVATKDLDTAMGMVAEEGLAIVAVH